MIKLNIPRHNVDIHNTSLAITYQWGRPREPQIIFLIPSRDGELKKDKNGFWYFEITIWPEKLYSVYAPKNEEQKYVWLNGDDLTKHIKQWEKQDNRDYN